MLAAAALIPEGVIVAGQVSVGNYLQADALSAWFDVIIGVVGSTGTLYAVGRGIWVRNWIAGTCQ